MTAPRPLYQQAKRYIVERIDSGAWSPETRVPSEHEFAETLGVSRMTVHRALRELTVEGRLTRIQGVGTFVARPKPQSALLEIRNIADEIADRGGTHSSEILLLRAEESEDAVARDMNLPPRGRVFHVVMLHRENGRPVQIEDRYVNPSVAPDFLDQDLTATTPSRYLLDAVPLTEAEHVIEAVMPDAEHRALLELDPAEPCLVLYRRTWAGPNVATRGHFIHPGSRYRLGGRFRPVNPSHPLVG